MNLNTQKKIIHFLFTRIKHFHYDDYWRYRSIVTNKNNKTIRLIKLYYLYKIKRMDAFNNASTGTDLNGGAFFKSPPHLPHGLNGIIIGHDTVIGKNVTIYHQVTIMHDGVVIGDNVIIGAGAKILPGCVIGNNVKIGANCVVVENIPENSTVVLPKPRIILKNNCGNNETQS